MSEPRLIAPEETAEDHDASLRPLALADFTARRRRAAISRFFIEAAKARRDPLDHVLFVGPPGLGKTTLAQIVARELGGELPLDLRSGDRQRRRSRRAIDGA